MNVLPDIQKPAASDLAYEHIRRNIVTGVLKEGERITEESLAKNLGLSRTPVREAISRLLHEGFIERSGGYSTRVASFPADELDQIFQIRCLLESYAARRAAQFATDKEIALLHDLSDTMSAHTPPQSEEDYEVISRANEQFHRTIMEAARSPRLMALLSMAVDVGMVVRTYHMYSENDLIRSSRHHHEIAEAIGARAPDWAAKIMASHILAAQATVKGPTPAGGSE